MPNVAYKSEARGTGVKNSPEMKWRTKKDRFRNILLSGAAGKMEEVFCMGIRVWGSLL